MDCASKRAGCEAEFRVPVDRMKEAFRRAEQYSVRSSPYGVPAYPYIWRGFPESMTVHMFMGYRGENRLIAAFQFEFQAGRAGACVHVIVWVVKPVQDPSVEGFGALPSKDTRLHAEAIEHFKGVLLGQPGVYTVVPPQLDQVPPPPPDAA